MSIEAQLKELSDKLTKIIDILSPIELPRQPYTSPSYPDFNPDIKPYQPYKFPNTNEPLNPYKPGYFPDIICGTEGESV